MVCGERNSSAAISGNDRCVDKQRQQAEFGGGQRRRSGDGRAALVGQPGPQRPGLADQGSEAGPPLEQLIDLPHQRPGPGQVGQRKVDAGELDPGLNGQVGERVGQQMPQPLGTDKLLARRRDVSPVRGCAGLHRTDKGRGVDVLDPGLTQHGACLPGEGPGPAPLVTRHRHQRPFAQRVRGTSGAPTSSAALTASCRDASPPSRSPLRTRAIPWRSAAAGITRFSAANLRTASSCRDVVAAGTSVARGPAGHGLGLAPGARHDAA